MTYKSSKTATRRKLRRQRFGGQRGWNLQDAKARFSEVVRLAREKGPQHVTVHGKEAVVVVSASDYARLVPAAAQPSLHALLSRSPLAGLEFEHASVRAKVRDVEL